MKAQLKKVYLVAFTAIDEVLSIKHLYGKCGGKCANFLISALAITLTHACQGMDYCRQNDTANAECIPNVYRFANQSIENLEPVALTCFTTVGIEVNQTQSRHISIGMCNAVIDAVKVGPDAKVSDKDWKEELGFQDTYEVQDEGQPKIADIKQDKNQTEPQDGKRGQSEQQSTQEQQRQKLSQSKENGTKINT